VKGEATDPTDFGDPTAGEHYRLCLYDESGGTPAVVLEAQVPVATTCGTKPCWKGLGSPSGSKGFRYKNKARTPHGVQVAVLKAGAEGKAKIVIKGGRENLFKGVAGAPPLPLPLPATLQLQNVRGECWQATYDTDGVGSNETGFFRGSGS